MSEVSKVNAVAIADIDTINGVDADDIESLDGVDFVTGFSNTYALRQMVSAGTGSMQVANPNSYHFESGGTDQPFSISAWVHGSVAPPSKFRIASKGTVAVGATATNQEWVLTTGSPPWYDPTANPPITFTLYGDTDASVYIQRHGGALAISGSWNHIVATYNGSGSTGDMKIYLNASDITSTTNPFTAGSYSSLADSGLPVIIGGLAGNSDRFQGYMDEVSIWSKELSSAKVTTIYNSGTPMDLQGSGSLLSWWRMGDNDGGTGTTVTDVQGTGNGSLSNTDGPAGAGSFGAGDGISSENVP